MFRSFNYTVWPVTAQDSTTYYPQAQSKERDRISVPGCFQLPVHSMLLTKKSESERQYNEQGICLLHRQPNIDPRLSAESGVMPKHCQMWLKNYLKIKRRHTGGFSRTLLSILFTMKCNFTIQQGPGHIFSSIQAKNSKLIQIVWES